MITFSKFNQIVGLDQVNAREAMYSDQKMQDKIDNWKKAGEL